MSRPLLQTLDPSLIAPHCLPVEGPRGCPTYTSTLFPSPVLTEVLSGTQGPSYLTGSRCTPRPPTPSTHLVHPGGPYTIRLSQKCGGHHYGLSAAREARPLGPRPHQGDGSLRYTSVPVLSQVGDPPQVPAGGPPPVLFSSSYTRPSSSRVLRTLDRRPTSVPPGKSGWVQREVLLECGFIHSHAPCEVKVSNGPTSTCK